MLIRRTHRAVLDANCLFSSNRPLISPYLQSHRTFTIATSTTPTTTTTSSSIHPDASARPRHDAKGNPHASTPDASHITSPPMKRTQQVPSAFQLAVRRAKTSPHRTSPPAPPRLPFNGPGVDPLPASVTSLLPSLAVQRPHYATMHIHEHPYLVTEGDRVRLPFRMPGVEPGDVLRLTRAKSLGSRDFTLSGAPWVDERLFVCRAVVAGVEAEPMRRVEKTKRRQRHIKTVRSKHRYTELVVQQLKVLTVEEVFELEKEEEMKRAQGGKDTAL